MRIRKSNFVIVLVVCFFVSAVHAQSNLENAAEPITIVVTVTNVSVGQGAFYIALFNSKKAYKDKEAFASKEVEANAEEITITFEVPTDEYVFSVFQDENSNGELDIGWFGIPKEPVGISNYSGKGIPGGFDDLKMEFNETNTKVLIPLSSIN